MQHSRMVTLVECEESMREEVGLKGSPRPSFRASAEANGEVVHTQEEHCLQLSPFLRKQPHRRGATRQQTSDGGFAEKE